MSAPKKPHPRRAGKQRLPPLQNLKPSSPQPSPVIYIFITKKEFFKQQFTHSSCYVGCDLLRANGLKANG
jgi:hypothetical protein